MVFDALSRKHQFRVMYMGKIKLQKEVQLMSRRYEFAKEVKQNIQKGIKSHFHLQVDCCGTSKIGFMFRKGDLRMCY